MEVAAFKGGGVEAGDENQVDAWWLWVAGLYAVGEAPFGLPADQVAALSKVQWPTVGGVS